MTPTAKFEKGDLVLLNTEYAFDLFIVESVEDMFYGTLIYAVTEKHYVWHVAEKFTLISKSEFK